MKTFKTRKSIFGFHFAALGFGTAIGIYIVVAQMAESYPSGRPDVWWFLILWHVYLAWLWYDFLKIPFEIELGDDSTVKFRSLLNRTTLSVREIKSMKFKLAGGWVKIKHTRGALKVTSHMHGFYDFVATLKSLNPSIELINY